MTILILKSLNAIIYPYLHCEDGSLLVSQFFNHHSICLLLDPHPEAGYTNLLPNLICMFIVFFVPLKAIPYSFALVPIFLAGLSLWRLSILPSKLNISHPSSLCLSMFLALLPLGNAFLNTALSYSIWNYLLLLIILSFEPLPSKPLYKVIKLFFMMLLCTSHPGCMILVPIWLWKIYRSDMQGKLFYSILILTASLYLIYFTKPSPTSQNAISLMFNIIPFTFHYIFERVCFQSILGNNLRLILQNANMLWLIWIFSIFLWIPIIIYTLKDKKLTANIYPVFIVVYLMLSMTVFYAIGRNMPKNAFEPWEHRYGYIQRAFFSLAFIISIANLKSIKKYFFNKKIITYGVLILVGLISLQEKEYNAPFYTKELGIDAVDFFNKADLIHKKIYLKNQNIIVTLDRGIWSIYLWIGQPPIGAHLVWQPQQYPTQIFNIIGKSPDTEIIPYHQMTEWIEKNIPS